VLAAGQEELAEVRTAVAEEREALAGGRKELQKVQRELEAEKTQLLKLKHDAEEAAAAADKKVGRGLGEGLDRSLKRGVGLLLLTAHNRTTSTRPYSLTPLAPIQPTGHSAQ